MLDESCNTWEAGGDSYTEWRYNYCGSTIDLYLTPGIRLNFDPVIGENWSYSPGHSDNIHDSCPFAPLQYEYIGNDGYYNY